MTNTSGYSITLQTGGTMKLRSIAIYQNMYVNTDQISVTETFNESRVNFRFGLAWPTQPFRTTLLKH